MTVHQRTGFDKQQWSIVGQVSYTKEHIVRHDTTSDRRPCWGKWGTLWGSYWELLIGPGILWLSDIGPRLVFDHLVDWLSDLWQGVGVWNEPGVGLSRMGRPTPGALAYATGRGHTTPAMPRAPLVRSVGDLLAYGTTCPYRQ